MDSGHILSSRQRTFARVRQREMRRHFGFGARGTWLVREGAVVGRGDHSVQLGHVFEHHFSFEWKFRRETARPA